MIKYILFDLGIFGPHYKLIVKLQLSRSSESFDKPCMDRIVNHLPVVLYGAYFMFKILYCT